MTLDIAALKESDQKIGAYLFKENGERLMLLVSSNAFKDREQEIVRQKALEEYVNNFTGNKLLWWHGGDAIGKVIDAQMVGAFLVEVAKELPNRAINLARKATDAPMNTTIKEVWDFVEDKGTGIDWGASIGFRFIRDDIEDGVFERILKFETSVLPLEVAANPFTFARVEVT
jgi:hypothetical protein